MNTELQNRRRAKSQLLKSINFLKSDLKSTVSFINYVSLLKLLHFSTLSYSKVVHTRQANILNWLDGSQATSVTWLDTGKIVVNLSSYKLSETELKLLSRGLKFSIPPHHLDSTDTLTSFESLFNQTTQGVKSNLNSLKHRFKSLCYQYTITDPIFPTYQSRNILHLKIYRKIPTL